jgi:hypothetical protein
MEVPFRPPVSKGLFGISFFWDTELLGEFIMTLLIYAS